MHAKHSLAIAENTPAIRDRVVRRRLNIRLGQTCAKRERDSGVHDRARAGQAAVLRKVTGEIDFAVVSGSAAQIDVFDSENSIVGRNAPSEAVARTTTIAAPFTRSIVRFP